VSLPTNKEAESGNDAEGDWETLDEIADQRLVLQKLDEARDELVQFKYHVSHDLSAPIASIHSLVDMVSEDIQNQHYDEVEEMLGETKDQLSRLDSLISDLMTLARAGAEDEPHTHVNLKQLVDDIVNSISLHARELEVSVSLEFDRPSIFTDSIRLRQILANLISNARKFSDPSELAPSILVQVTTSGENRVLTVSDNGIGMSDEIAERAFGLFNRGSATHSGHGLGLYIAKKHVDKLGGSIRVANASKPTIFKVLLPVDHPVDHRS